MVNKNSPLHPLDYLAPGDVVFGLEPSRLVEIQDLAPFASKALVEGIGVQSRGLIRRPLTQEELSSLVKVRGRSHTFQGDAQALLLGAEAKRIQTAHQFGPLFAVNSSIVDPLPHQGEKEEMVDWDGRHLFKERHTWTVGYKGKAIAISA